MCGGLPSVYRLSIPEWHDTFVPSLIPVHRAGLNAKLTESSLGSIRRQGRVTLSHCKTRLFPLDFIHHWR